MSVRIRIPLWTASLLAALAAMFPPSLFAGAGTTALSLLQENLSARAAAMGGPRAALPDGSASVQANPAGLGLLPRPEFNISYVSSRDYGRYGFGAYAHPFVWGPWRASWAAGITYFNAGNVDVVALDGTSRSLNAETDYIGALALGIRAGRWGAVGVAPKFIRSTLAEQYSAQAFAADLGVILTPLPGSWRNRLWAGFLARHIGSKVKYKSQEEDLPQTQAFGVSVTAFKGRDAGSLLLSAEAEQAKGEKTRYRMGGEYAFGSEREERAFFLRGGMRIHFESEDYSVGLGARERNFEISYAFVNGIELEKTHRVNLVFRFGQPWKKAGKEPDLLDLEQEKALLREELIDRERTDEKTENILMPEGSQGTGDYYLYRQTDKPKK